jgi:ribonucleoside-triphosphate reductase (formate)
MNINIKTNKNFTTQYNKMLEKYGEEFELINGLHDSQMNYGDFIDNFTKDNKNTADNTIDSNANVSSKDIQSLLKEKGKSHDKLIAFNKIFYELQKKYGIKIAREWLDLEFGPYLYMHDAPSASYFPYCFAYDLSRLAKEGLFFIENYNNEPPKHLQTFLDDVIEYISFMSNRSSGAVGIPDILIWMFYFWKHDVEKNYLLVSPEYYLKQAYQKLIFRLNQKFYRDQTQTVFSNVSIFDRVYLEELFGGREYPDGTFVIDYIDEIMDAQKLFMEVISETRRTQLFTYPVLTYSLIYKDGKFADEEFARWASNHNRKWNDSNFFISETAGALSNCCRLISDTTQLDPFINSIGGTALSVGSVKVSTINLEAIALECPNNQEEFLNKLTHIQDIDMKALDVVRHIIQRNIEKGLLPNFIDGGMEMDKMFCTVGFLGLYEVMEIYGYINTDEFGNKSYSDDGIIFASKIFDTMNHNKEEFVKDKDYKINLESVPGESAAVKLAAKDRLLYGEEKTHEILSNQWIPLTAKCTIKEKVRLSGLFDKKCGGGVIAHINIENEFPTEEAAWDMLNYLAKNKVIYFAFNSKINECEHHHGFVGTDICPECGSPVIDTYQRIVGYLVPSRNYSSARKKEFSKRQWYEIGQLSDNI